MVENNNLTYVRKVPRMGVTVGTPQTREQVGARLKRLRLERRLSQRDLSSPGVSYAYISRIEAGARTPSVKALRMLARKLGVSVEYLETGSDLRDVEQRELRLADAELELRLADDPAAAEQKLRDIQKEAEAAGDHVSASRARIAVGLAAASQGRHLDAVERLEEALDDEGVTPHLRPDVYAALGQSYSALGAPERAVRLFDRAIAELHEVSPENPTTLIWFATLLSYALSDAGDYDRAREVVKGALADAEDTADHYTRVRLYWSMARLAGMEGRSNEALEHIRNAIALLKSTDDDLRLARAYLLSAGIEAQEGDASGARKHLENAKQLLGTRPDPADVGMLRIGESRVAALEGDADAAVARARAAIDLLGQFNAAEQGTAVWALARGLSLANDVTGANDAYRRAVDLLTVHGRRHDAAQACLDWGTFHREQGREEEAEQAFRRAADLGLKADVEAARNG
jgi:tetratricopeptide (TPR) repeat protein